jgi:Probable transposase
MRSSDPFCAAELVLARRWERGEITDQQLISAIRAIVVRQAPLQQTLGSSSGRERAIAREPDRQSEENDDRVEQFNEVKVSEFELRIIHRSMDGDGALIEIPVRAAVVEWLIPEDETGPLMSYYEIVSATEEETGDPFDRHLITEAEFCEALASEEEKGSHRRKKAKRRVARVYQKIRRQRNDFAHKVTTDLVGRFDMICIEDLSIQGMARTKLARSVKAKECDWWRSCRPTP